MDDLISRKMAIDALDKRFDSIPMEQTTEILMLRKDLRELPPAQPEVAKDTNVPNNDCISRHAAIDEYGDWYVEEGTEEGFIGTVKQLLEALPSAQPQRKTGKWIDLKCNQCGQVDMSKPNFCPFCGADMRGESDE